MSVYLNLADVVYPTPRLFGQRLKERRQKLGLTQLELQQRTDVTAPYISLVERGKANPTLGVMVKLAEAVQSEAWAMIRPGDEDWAQLVERKL